jgi:hypothetical protein
MKASRNIFLILVLATAIMFTSCKKSTSPYEGPVFNTLIYDARYYNLAGREFIFDSLVWEVNDFNQPVFLIVQRPDPFFNPNWTYEVSIKPDTSSAWVNVFRAPINSPPSANSFLYNILSGRIVVYHKQTNNQLTGSVSLKIKFP